MKKLFALALALLMTALSCAAYAGAQYIPEENELPGQVIDLQQTAYPGYAVEDYAEMPDTPRGDLALILLRNEKERRLLIAGIEGAALNVLYKTAAGVPQNKNDGWITVYPVGSGFTDAVTDEWVSSDGLYFRIGVNDENNEAVQESVTYHWEDGSFMLKKYSHDIVWNCSIRDGYLDYWTNAAGFEGRVYGEVQQDIRWASYASLPKTIKEARQSVTLAPQLPTGRVFEGGGQTVSAREIEFTGGEQHPVYLGPGEAYARSADGKGSVSTNDWIQVFGEYDGWIMIQYDISAERYRVGWITADALPKGESVPHLNLCLDAQDYNSVNERCILTDDPFNSQTVIAVLEPGQMICEVIYDMGGWSYIRVTIGGETMCGFVPTMSINHG